ncbi:hypothetical protein [Pelosinus sp. UFO1]|uniref:hypothetical protein n=1 Tax=Pelosinus sp. UFO1 TaxID=484770 RepID=UPI0004D0EAAD|nr:hypothetical protein [Pelosinus sp. UFO1]AIF54096.1 hypothetical protein UFO1_4561 [Pelosinus sp. UFO1]
MIKLEDVNFDKKTIIIIAIGLFIVGVLGWFMFGRGIPDTGSAIDQTRSNLSTVGDKQQSAIERLDVIENGLTNSADKACAISAGIGNTTKSINSVEGRITESQDRLKSSAGLITEGKSILRQVRERGQVGN